MARIKSLGKKTDLINLSGIKEFPTHKTATK